MDKYRKADRRLASLLEVDNAHWTHNGGAAHELQVAHGINLDFGDGCCCAHMGGPTMNWVWFHDHTTKGLAVRFALVMALIHSMEINKNE